MKKALSIILLLIFVFSAGCVNNSTTDGTTADKTEPQTKSQNAEGFFPHDINTDRKPYTAVEIPDVANDPYSRVIKEYYQLVLDGSEDVPDTLKYSRYALYDIDGDGTKELLLSCAHSSKEQMNRNMFLEHIFAIKDGTAFEVKFPNDQFPNGEFSDRTLITDRWVFSNGLITVSAERNWCYFRYANGALTYVCDFVYKASDTDDPYQFHYKYYAPDETGKRQLKEELTYAEVLNLRQELNNGAIGLRIVWLPLESYGRLKNARDYYSVILKDKYDSFSDKEYMSDRRFYQFYDIDGNGTEELLLADKDYLWGNNSLPLDDPKEEGIVFDTFYTFDGEKAEEVPYKILTQWYHFDQSFGGRDILTNGIIKYYGGSPEYTSYAYFTYVDGKLEFRTLLLNYANGDLWVYNDYFNEQAKEKITKKEFDRIRAEIEDGAKAVDIDWQTINSFTDKNS